jgi:hypothetical protein
MTLPVNQDFATEDADQLRTDLQLEHGDIRDEFDAFDLKKADEWTVQLIGDAQTVRAVPRVAYAGSTFTVMTPGKPRPGDVFSVVGKAGCSISILSDDGSLIQGGASDSIGGGAFGWYRWIWVASPDSALQGWWR